MSIKIGHASIDENGNAHGGTAGDQTGKEVCTRTWYSKPWTCILRPSSTTVAEKIAKAMEQACANNNIGYDQYQRTTLYTQAKAKSWDLSKITTACETDCSALVAVCVNAAGVTVSKDMYTGNEASILTGTGKFTKYTDSKYLTSDKYLKRGDILLSSGHTAVVLENGSAVSTTSTASSSTVTAPTVKNGTYTLTAVRGVYKGYGSATGRKKVKDLTADGKKHTTSTTSTADAYLKSGTSVTISATKLISTGNLWAKIPSGYICIWEKSNNKKYIK